MKLWVVILFLLLLVGFNLSYLSNSGLLVVGLKNARRITYRNAHLHSKSVSNNISTFRMEPFMTQQECYNIAAVVYALKDNWEQRNVAMYTLGTASYLDGATKTDYIEKSMKSNPLIAQHFQPLLEKVLTYFRAKTTSRVVYRDNAALPGFHVFDCNKIFSLPVASVHRDLQWNRLTYDKHESIDMANMLSFTLAIELPPGGGGLYTFDMNVPPLLTLLIPRGIMSSMAPKTKIEYKEGYMVTHNGLTDHMIAPCKQSAERKRITLQGHGVYEKNADTWYIYW